jgi:two-component system phosphate regulon sensor histidine kinase PhoR
MKSRRWRLRPLVVLAVLAGAAIALVTAYFSAKQFLRDTLARRLAPEAVQAIVDEFGNAFLAYSAIALLLTGGIAFALGSVVRSWLAELREETVGRARGNAKAPGKPPVTELHGLSVAIDHLATGLEERAEAFRRERDELALLITSVSEGILLTGRHGRIIHANPAARRLLGLPEACHGQPLVSLVRNADLRVLLERIERNGEPGQSEVMIDDRRLLVHGRLLPSDDVSAASVDPPGAVIAFIDLTELRRLEGVRRDFVANVSHELKTPLTSIRGYSETLLSDDVDPVTQRHFVEVIQKNAERLQTMVDDLLDLSRLESGGWKPDIEETSAAGVVAEAWQLFSDRARDKKIEFVPPATDQLVLADEAALRQILSNLFDNAIRHTGSGGSVRVSIRLDAAEKAARNGSLPGSSAPRQRVTIEVRDSGSGIPSDALPRIFERFYRVDPARSRAEGGTGLGLSIVKHMVESMDGEVSAASELGKGTTIRVRLPAVAA